MASANPPIWPIQANWASQVGETLEWLTDIMRANATGHEQTRQLREVPRRTLKFQALIHNHDWRVVDNFLRRIGVELFRLPIFPDAQELPNAITAGALQIPCATNGYDFTAGGLALLGNESGAHEIVTISSISVTGLTLTAATANAWPMGTRLVPLRTARLASTPQLTDKAAEVSTFNVQAVIDEPSNWPAAWPGSATYRGQPVLEWRGNWQSNPAHQYARDRQTVDMKTGPVFYVDLPDRPFRKQVMHFFIHGRAGHTRFRSFLYQLAGRMGTLWVPDWTVGLVLAADAASGDTQLTIVNQGYSALGGPVNQQRDLRIELIDGTIIYRRVTASADAGATETLTLDSSLPQAVTQSNVLQIGWMTLSAHASDTVTIQHQTNADGVALADMHWEALANDV